MNKRVFTIKFDRGTFLKAIRLERDLTLDDGSSKTGVTKQTLYKYEKNIVTNIPPDKIEELAKLYNISPAKIRRRQLETDSELSQKNEREIESDLEYMISVAYDDGDNIEDLEAFKATIKAAIIQTKKITKKYPPKMPEIIKRSDFHETNYTVPDHHTVYPDLFSSHFLSRTN